VRSPVHARQNRDLGRAGKEKPSERTALPVEPDYIPCGQKYSIHYIYIALLELPALLLALSYPVYLSLGMRKELPAKVSHAIPVPAK
jgi:hypothetical protein